jgi:cytochrome P450
MTPFETIDYFTDLALIDDPHPYFRHLRSIGPVVELPSHGVLAVVGHQEGLGVLLNHEDFSSITTATGPIPPIPFEPDGDDITRQIEAHRPTMPFGAMLVAQDRPDHTATRRLLNGLLTPNRFRENEEYLSGLADRKIDEFIDSGRLEVITGYAHPFATLAIADFLGMPEEAIAPALEGCGRMPGVIGDTREMENNPLEQLAMHFFGMLSERRSNPRKDVMSVLAQTTHADGSLPEIGKLVSLAAVLFGAGQDSTVRLIAATLKTLAERPDLQDKVRAEPGLIPKFIEEVLRLDGSTKSFFRLAKRRAQVGGIDIDPGTTVMVVLSAMNRDPRVFENPDEFQIERSNVRKHLAFGAGIHACIGAPLARAEARLTVEKLLRRTRNIRLDAHVHGPEGARRFEYQPNYTQRALSSLSIVFDKA